MPTCDELGVKGFDIATMLGLLGARRHAAAVVATLQAETAKALRDPKMAERMVQLGVVMQENGTAHYQKFVRDDYRPLRRDREEAEPADQIERDGSASRFA